MSTLSPDLGYNPTDGLRAKPRFGLIRLTRVGPYLKEADEEAEEEDEEKEYIFI